MLTDCAFLHNEAIRFGGGDVECAATAAPRFVQCTFYGGSGPAGAAIVNKDRSHPTLQNCILASCSGGQVIECKDTAQVTLSCCNLHGNTGGDWIGCIESQGNVAGNSSVDPGLSDPERGDLSLKPRSKLRDREGCGMLGARVFRGR